MVREAVLLYLIMAIGRSEFLLGTALIQRPIIVGTLVGLVFGDLQAGIIMGATMELAFIGAVSIGAYIPPDMLSGTVLGVAFAITSGRGAEAALTLGMPIATLMLALRSVIGEPLKIGIAHLADKHVAEGNYKMFTTDVILLPLIIELLIALVVPFAYYFGSESVTNALSGLPEFVIKGIEIATGLLPALGFAMLAQMIMNKKVTPFFFFGFFLVSYFADSGLTTTGVAIFAIIIATILYYSEDKINVPKNNISDGEEYLLDEF